MKIFLKVPQSVRERFERLAFLYGELKDIVDSLIKECKEDRWLYFSRIKQVESFYAKMSQGRKDALFEDILACTVVVERPEDIGRAIGYLNDYFVIQYKRPCNPQETNKFPEVFQFDDLRLYVKLQDRPRYADYKDCIFEIQVKTILQHAWTVVTHDLIYKSDRADSWARKRVAFQIKAMLEHVETSMSKVDELASSDLINMSTRKINERIKIAEQIKDWNFELGSATTRIAENIQNLMVLFDVHWCDVVGWVNQETQTNQAGGLNATRFSLYEIVLDAICKYNSHAIITYQKNIADRRRDKIIVADEFMDIHPEYEGCFQTISGLAQ